MRATFPVLFSLFCLLPAFAAAEDTAWEDELREAATAYDAGDMQGALLHYSKARKIRDVPKLRLQVAHIHEQLGECNAARLLYTEVVEGPAAEEVRTMAGERLQVLGDCSVAVAPVVGEPAVAEPAVSSNISAKKRLPKGRKIVGYSLVGGGSASLLFGLITAAGFLVPANVKECVGLNTSSADCTAYGEQLGKDGVILTDLEDLRERADRVVSTHQMAAVVSMLGGVALITTGTIVLLTGKRAPVAIVPTASGFQLVGTFR